MDEAVRAEPATRDGDTSADGVALDGRRARRDRNRTAVLDAVLELFAEGHLAPSADQVARRSGVSLRSVYRYVEDSDDLIRAAVERRREQVAHLFTIDDLGEGPLVERIAALSRSRVHAYEAVAPTARASRARAYASPVLAEQLDLASQQLRSQVAAQFRPELSTLSRDDRRSVLAAADALCQLETIDLLRHRRGLTIDEAVESLTTALTRLLDHTA
jgi:AcrR family transcriptional regulator